MTEETRHFLNWRRGDTLLEGWIVDILIPTPAELNGDFSSARTGVTKGGTCSPGSFSQGSCQLYDPTAGATSYATNNNYGPYRAGLSRKSGRASARLTLSD